MLHIYNIYYFSCCYYKSELSPSIFLTHLYNRKAVIYFNFNVPSLLNSFIVYDSFQVDLLGFPGLPAPSFLCIMEKMQVDSVCVVSTLWCQVEVVEHVSLGKLLTVVSPVHGEGLPFLALQTPFSSCACLAYPRVGRGLGPVCQCQFAYNPLKSCSTHRPPYLRWEQLIEPGKLELTLACVCRHIVQSVAVLHRCF